MSWFMRGVQSAIFHYASCAPCTGYMYRKKRRKQARKDNEARRKLNAGQPELYPHPGPTGTNPYWTEEIAMGPGPPPRRAKRTNTGTGSQRGITTADTHSTVVSNAGSSIDVDQTDGQLRSSEDTLDDVNWNRRRYQREDEDLWGFGEPSSLARSAMAPGSSVGVSGLTRPGTSKSSAESYYAARAPPVNDLHPPIVSMPSPHPSDNHWMLQPPPKASIMSGKERATNRSRSGSGASSRVELSLQRQVSARQLRQKLERGQTPELPSISRGSSYSNLVTGQRHDRPKTPQVRPPSAASSRKKKKRRDTAFTTTTELERSSGDSSDTVVHRKKAARSSSGIERTPLETVAISSELSTPSELSVDLVQPRDSPKDHTVPNLKVVRVRNSRPQLSTVMSSGDTISPDHNMLAPPGENQSARRPRYSSTQSSDSTPYLMKHRAPLGSSDISSLNVLQDLVSPRALLNSRFVSAPLMEARIKLPPSDMEEEEVLNSSKDWTGSGFSISREWGTDDAVQPVPFDSLRVLERDPRMRWSVDF